MKSTIGNIIQVTVFGESHGKAIGAVINGLPCGIRIDEKWIAHQMKLRKPKGAISTARHEQDEVQLISGVFRGKTTGHPVCLMILNQDAQSKDYELLSQVARPSHVDWVAHEKYQGYQDYRGSGHFSGRLTASVVASGAIAIDMLRKKGIEIATHIQAIADVEDESFSHDAQLCTTQMKQCQEDYFAVLDKAKKEAMVQVIEEARKNQDSVGGILETIVMGLPIGIGEPMFDSLESCLSHGLFSIGAVKGVEFGDGFALAKLHGSEANDAFILDQGQIKTQTNHNGGINGGISNGMPLRFRIAIKPTASISKPQQTVNFLSKTETILNLTGRHDPCIVHRAKVVVDSVVALVLVDLCAQQFGLNWFEKESLCED